MEENITVTRPDFIPVPDRKCETICMADMTLDERRIFRETVNCPIIKKHLQECELSGVYNDCNRNHCKEMQDAKEKQESDKEARTERLQERNQLLERWARDTETKQKKMEADIAKMANLISQLISKQ